MTSCRSPGLDDFDIATLTSSENNATVRNYSVQNSNNATLFSQTFLLRNTLRQAAWYALRVEKPPKWTVSFGGRSPVKVGARFMLKPEEERLVSIEIQTPRRGAAGAVNVIQERVIDRADYTEQRAPATRSTWPVGGLTIQLQPRPGKAGDAHRK